MIIKKQQGQSTITCDKKQGTLIIEAPTQILKSLIKKLKLIDLPSPEVRIDATIINIDRNYLNNIGINLSRFGSPSTHTIIFPMLNLHGHNLLNLRLNTLARQGHVEVLAKPTLLVLNQQSAHIESGTEIPYQEKTKRGDTTIAFKKATLSLDVNAKVISPDSMLMHITVHHDTPSHLVIKGEPAINTQQLETTVTTANDHTIILGGIISSERIVRSTHFPLLYKLPLVGNLFTEKETHHQTKMLLLILTPHIIKPH